MWITNPYIYDPPSDNYYESTNDDDDDDDDTTNDDTTKPKPTVDHQLIPNRKSLTSSFSSSSSLSTPASQSPSTINDSPKILYPKPSDIAKRSKSQMTTTTSSTTTNSSSTLATPLWIPTSKTSSTPMATTHSKSKPSLHIPKRPSTKIEKLRSRQEKLRDSMQRLRVTMTGSTAASDEEEQQEQQQPMVAAATDDNIDTAENSKDTSNTNSNLDDSDLSLYHDADDERPDPYMEDATLVTSAAAATTMAIKKKQSTATAATDATGAGGGAAGGGDGKGRSSKKRELAETLDRRNVVAIGTILCLVCLAVIALIVVMVLVLGSKHSTESARSEVSVVGGGSGNFNGNFNGGDDPNGNNPLTFAPTTSAPTPAPFSSEPTPAPSTSAPTMTFKPTMQPSSGPTLSLIPSSTPSLRPSAGPTDRPSASPTNHPTDLPSDSPSKSMQPTVTPIDPNHDFKIRLYWEQGYFWQEDWSERWWCMECTNCSEEGTGDGWEHGCEYRGDGEAWNCRAGDLFWVKDCRRGGTRFNVVQQPRTGAFLVRLDNTNLCLDRNNRYIRARTCDMDDPDQMWAPIPGLHQFELRALSDQGVGEREARCASQHHHPKDEEVVSMHNCRLSRIYETQYWEEY